MSIIVDGDPGNHGGSFEGNREDKDKSGRLREQGGANNGIVTPRRGWEVDCGIYSIMDFEYR